MRCAYSATTSPAYDDAPGHTGGDIVAVVETSAAVRVLVGDVMGHGPRAGETAVEVGHAFERLAAHEEDPPQVIAARLDRFIADWREREHAGGAGEAAQRRRREEFVTAQLIDVPRGCAGGEPRIVCCGHPPPLVLSGDRAVFLDVSPSAPPLGLLGMTSEACPRSCALGARAGDAVLLYTDGVTEARNAQGIPYPFASRAATVAGTVPAAPDGSMGAAISTGGAIIDAIKADLLDHAGGTLRDDATLVYLWLADDPCGTVPCDTVPCHAGREDTQVVTHGATRA